MNTPPLSTLYCYLTQGCNLACRHCWLQPQFDPDGNKYPCLDVGLFAAVIDEARPLGLDAVKLTGGEPLLHPDFDGVLEAVRTAGLTLQVETNGVLCTAATAAALAACRDPSVSVSLDSPRAAVHDHIRGVPGAFERACAGVRHLAEAGLGPQVVMTVMAENLDDVDGMVGLAEDLGAGSVKFNIVQPTARGEALHAGAAVADIDRIIALSRRVNLELASQTELRLEFDVPMAFRPLSLLAAGRAAGRCGIMQILGLLPTGHYALCGIGEHLPDLVFGRAGVDDLRAVWAEHPVLVRLRQEVPGAFEGVCGRCLMKHLCLGSCIAQNYYRTGSLTGAHWFCEQAEAQGLFPPSRSERLAARRRVSRKGAKNAKAGQDGGGGLNH